MRIAILGTRGIPNNYGGFEQCAEYLALGLVARGHEVIVYNSHNHLYQHKTWRDVMLVHKFDPEYKVGTIGQFLYDLNCIVDVRSRKCDVILQLGYTSSSVWGWLLPKRSIVTTNMDGLEWKRAKYSAKVKKFLLFAERLGVKFSHHLISDSIGIKNYLREKYDVNSTHIPYGAHLFLEPDIRFLSEYTLKAFEYDILIARLEPENSLEIILDGVVKSNNDRKFLVIGNNDTNYGKFLIQKYKAYQNILFLGGIYDIEKLNNLRHFSNLYFHGHTVGGTNPSLLEAMASSALISANDNSFNRNILGDEALYFTKSDDIAKQLITVDRSSSNSYNQYIEANRLKIKDHYSWETIVHQYEDHFMAICGQTVLSEAPVLADLQNTI